MKANELRIGNWVEQTLYSSPTESMINTVDGSYIAWLEKGDADCKPIPLTEEWLLKFGFEKDQYGDFYIEFNGTKYKSYIIDINNGISAFGVSYQDDTFYFAWNIKYVHQLQNLVYALTGEELIA